MERDGQADCEDDPSLARDAQIKNYAYSDLVDLRITRGE